VLFVIVSFAANRPHYGGTLRIATRSALMSLDPAQQTNSLSENNITRLMFDTLTVVNDRGNVQPSLASSCEAEPGNQRWRIKLRSDVTFADGSALTTDAVASSLRASNPSWKIFPNSDSVTIETETPDQDLPAELALTRNSIAKRGGILVGTGAFTVTDWQPGKNLALAARENYWAGRPYVDSITISLGQNQREQMISLDLGKTDVIEIASDQAHRAGMENRLIDASQPVELLALVFTRENQGAADDEKLRRALALSIDRASINNVLLQGAGVPTGSLLPDWMSGYSFLFPSEFNLAQAHQLRNQLTQAANWTLGYDINDPLGRLIADRIALNARDAGIAIQVSSGGTPDLRLTRIRIDSLDTRLALRRVTQGVGLPASAIAGNSAEDLFSVESSVLEAGRVIPLLHVRVSYGLSSSVKNWNESPDGSWHLGDVWIGADKE
jgi:ABC-type transport system substrate-binding protein